MKMNPSHGIPDVLKELWHGGFFVTERSVEDIQQRLSNAGYNPAPNSLRKALSRVDFLMTRGRNGARRYIQRAGATRFALGKDILPEGLANALGNDFECELRDLQLNYGRSGTCTAFLLRKMLEKLIFIVFAKNGMASKLKDANGDFLGLNSMLKLAATNAVDNIPLLMPKTAREIEGIKFLGDTSAHNPLVNVDMKTIAPVMPYIVTAYLELAKRL